MIFLFFASDENHKLTRQSEMHLGNSQKLLNFISIFSQKNMFYGAQESESERTPFPRDSSMTEVISSIPCFINNLTLLGHENDNVSTFQCNIHAFPGTLILHPRFHFAPYALL